LTEADVVLALLTPGSVDSKWVLHEIGAAWAMQKLIIPVVSQRDILNKMPIPLQDTQAIELSDLANPLNADRFVNTFESLATARLV
jgi:hypothetical protein